MKTKTQYDYTKLDNFEIIIQTEDKEQNKRITKFPMKSAYSVSSGSKTINPDFYTLIVHKNLLIDSRYKDYPNCWVVTEQSTGMIIIDSIIAEQPLKTRDQAVDLALKYIRKNVNSKEKALNVLQSAKKKWIDEALVENE